MERTAVKSSNIKSIGFERTSPMSTPEPMAILGTVEVEFMNGSIYQHKSVPSVVFGGVMSAPSIGAAYNIALKGRYDVQKIQDARAAAAKSISEMLSVVGVSRAVMDSHTCPACAEVDSTLVTAARVPPHSGCTNPLGCRCVLVQRNVPVRS